MSEALGIGRGVLEGDVNSPIFFIIGLETVFREADEISQSLGLTGGIKLRNTNYDKVAFADDVTMTGGQVGDLSHRVQILLHSSSKAGLTASARKSCSQHIGYSGDAPAVTARDIELLNPRFECPKSWCTRPIIY